MDHQQRERAGGDNVCEAGAATQREINKLEEMNNKQEKRVKNLEIKSIQVLNLYFVFQAVVLLTSASSSLQCHNWWIPFSLSLIAATLNLFTAFGNMSKILKSREQLDQNKADLAVMRLSGVTKVQLSQVLPGTPLNRSEIVRPVPDKVRRLKQRVLAYSTIGLFTGFSGVVMYGCYTILCHSSTNKDNCVKIC